MRKSLPTLDLMLPGNHVSEVKSFHLGITDMPFINYKHYKDREFLKKMYNYEERLLLLPFSEVFQIRLADYKKICKKYL